MDDLGDLFDDTGDDTLDLQALNGADVAANAEADAPAEDDENEADAGVRLRGPTRQEQIRRATVALVPDIDRTVPGKDRLSLCPLPATLSYVTAPFDENTYDPAEDEAEAKRQRGGKDGDHARALTHLRWKFVRKEDGAGVEPSTAASTSSSSSSSGSRALPGTADAQGMARISNARIIEWSDGKTFTLQVGSRHYALPIIPTTTAVALDKSTAVSERGKVSSEGLRQIMKASRARLVPPGEDPSGAREDPSKAAREEIVLETLGTVDSLAVPRLMGGAASGAVTRAAVLEARLRAEQGRGQVRISSGLPNVKQKERDVQAREKELREQERAEERRARKRHDAVASSRRSRSRGLQLVGMDEDEDEEAGLFDDVDVMDAKNQGLQGLRSEAFAGEDEDEDEDESSEEELEEEEEEEEQRPGSKRKRASSEEEDRGADSDEDNDEEEEEEDDTQSRPAKKRPSKGKGKGRLGKRRRKEAAVSSDEESNGGGQADEDDLEAMIDGLNAETL